MAIKELTSDKIDTNRFRATYSTEGFIDQAAHSTDMIYTPAAKVFDNSSEILLALDVQVMDIVQGWKKVVVLICRLPVTDSTALPSFDSKTRQTPIVQRIWFFQLLDTAEVCSTSTKKW